ncbi:hypothetical protein BDY19DRAFT_1056842 [Irpex rosettiformis]|uniref:Uncharacterized protein n=1 Tax=Irpex rosettiformis TaxID=378272 RepID=A0ACB8U4U0_9APHY|nr:hypothetical protein BDY19DRAFT_1056842 [Irpex rosettiformis]
MMAGNFEPFAGPTYITSRSADVILSDVRPIKLKLEALRSVNVLLDEFLYNILDAANSLSTDKLKAGLHKVLPTTLGKDAVLEAELELKAYWERNAPHTPTNQVFDLQWSFELLRLKCEAYSTMNDTDEDAEVERRLNERMVNAGGVAPPHTSLMAPAALYLTAILEHICQHGLSNVSRVAARDSSRTLATVHDLFVALCEDPAIYSTFKTMKVYEQIEALSKAPRRVKSISKSSNKSIDRSRAASPSIDSLRDATLPHRARLSSDSVTIAAAAVLSSLGPGRGSQEKSRMKLFGGRSSGDQDRSETPKSFDEEGRGGSFELMDEEAQREFDELMRSSTTMKVSLTPDRLKSMEVYKQEKRRKAPVRESENDPVITISGGGGVVKRAVSARRAQARLVDAITEDDEPSPIKAHPSSVSQASVVPRIRQKSLTAAATSPSVPSEALPLPRTRSVTISSPQVQKKRPIGQIRPGIPKVPSTILIPSQENSLPSPLSAPPMQNGRPPRTRKVARHRESMDLDEIMGVEDDELGALSPPPRTPRTPSSKRDPSKPYISKSAKELIDFLDEGPPLELEPPHINASVISLESSKSKSGRLQRMMSKLSLGGSSEKLNGSSDTRRSPSVNGTAPSSYILSSISSRNGRQMPTVVIATPPPPPSSFSSPPTVSHPSPPAYPSPPVQYASSQSAITSPTFSPNGSISSAFPHQELGSSLGRTTPSEFNVPEKVRISGRRTSIIRKAVPSLEPPSERSQDRRDSPSPSPSNVQTIIAPPVEKSRTKSSSPLDEFPPVPTAVNIPPHARQRNDTLSGRSEMSIGAVIWAESSSTNTPVDSPIGTASPSPSSSIRRPSKQTSLRSVATPSTPTSIPPHVNGVNGVHHQHQLRQSSVSPEPAPAIESQSLSQAQTHVVEASGTTVESVPDVQAHVSKSTTAVHSSPAFTLVDAQDLRRMVSAASSADECRLIIDMFLVKSGYPVLTGPFDDTPVSEVDLSKAGEELSKKVADNAGMERSLVMHYLGGFDDDAEDSTPISV